MLIAVEAVSVVVPPDDVILYTPLGWKDGALIVLPEIVIVDPSTVTPPSVDVVAVGNAYGVNVNTPPLYDNASVPAELDVTLNRFLTAVVSRAIVTAPEPLYEVPVNPVPNVNVFKFEPRETPEIVLFARAELGTELRRAFGNVPLVILEAFVVSVVAEVARPVILEVAIEPANIVLVTVPVSPVVTTVPVVAGKVIVFVPAIAAAWTAIVPLVDPGKDNPVVKNLTLYGLVNVPSEPKFHILPLALSKTLPAATRTPPVVEP
jgi:hypothetical protein